MNAMNRSILSAALLAALAGCSTAMVEPVKKDVLASYDKAKTLVVLPVAQPTAVTRTSASWIPLKEVKQESAKLPVEFAKTFKIDRDFASVAEVAERVTFLAGIPVSLSPDVMERGAAAVTASVPQTQLPVMPSMPGQAMLGMPAMPGMPGMPNQTSQQSIPLSYSGTLSGFLDFACARFGISWEYKNGSIILFRTTTKTFTVHALPGDTSLDAKISNQGGGTSSSNSTHNAGVSFSSLSVWTALEKSITGMVTSQGKVAVTPATGTVTVTDVPYAVARVEKFVEEQNVSLGRQVLINVRVMTVSLNDSDDYGVNWNLVYNALSQNIGASMISSFSAAANSTAIKFSVLPTAGGSRLGQFAGSDAIVNAISQQGRVSLVTSASVTTLNNQPVPVQVGRQTAYLASSSTTTTPNVGSTTSITPGVITTGFSMNLLPHILEQGRMLLQYAIDISSLDRMMTITSGGSSIQTPEIQTRNFLQRVAVRSGETLVLSGFEQSTDNAVTAGTGSAENVLAGGSVSGQRKRDVIVILITPLVADRF